MDVSPQAIREVQFRERLRGYHPDDVDDYLARVAAAVEALELRVQQPPDQGAGPPAADATGDPDDSLRRTLVLAQRTADLAIREAREEAARLVAEAEARRDEMLASAHEERQQMTKEADQAVRAEIDRLHDLRQRLQDDVSALEIYLEAERERLRAVLTEQLSQIDEAPVLNPAPDLYEIDEAEVASAVAVAPPDAVATVPSPGSIEMAEDGGGAGGEEPAATYAADAADETTGIDPSAPAEGDPDEQEDAFMAELRLASTDEEPLGPRDPVSPGPDDDDVVDFFDDPDDRSRFGSRLRRRR